MFVSENKFAKVSNLLKETNYIKEAFAAAISRFGDGIDTIAFAWLVYEITGSTLLVATVYAVNGIPNLIFGICSGVLCKYLSEKKIMAICDFGRAFCVAVIAFLYFIGKLDVWQIYVITFLNSSFESFRSPAATSIVPQIIRKENLDNGIALSSSLSKVFELLGLSIAPLFIATIDLSGAIIVDSITFIISGLLIVSMKMAGKHQVNEELTIKSAFVDFKDGFKYIAKDKFIMNICIFACVINALLVPFNSLKAPYVDKVLHGGSEAISIMTTSIILAMAITMIFINRIKEKVGAMVLFIMGGFIVGCAYYILSIIGSLPSNMTYFTLCLDTLFMGTGAVFINFPIQIAMLKKIPQEYLGRVVSLVSALTLCSVPLTSTIIGIVSEVLDIKDLFMAFGILTAVLFIAQVLNKYIKEFNEY